MLDVFLFCNIQGLYTQTNQTKVSHLTEMAKQNNYTIIALTETHLNGNILDTEINIPNYILFRADRRNRAMEELPSM